MDWLWAAVAAWFGWNVVAPLVFIIVAMIVVVIINVPRWVKQDRCAHDRYFETRSCDAICSACGKNLGFIGTWRESQRKLMKE